MNTINTKNIKKDSFKKHAFFIKDYKKEIKFPTYFKAKMN
jgi:hypothetical protein